MRNTNIIKRDVFNILEKFFAMPDLPPDVIGLKNAAYGLAYLRSANRGYVSGDFEAAKSDLARAIDFAPDLLSNRGDRLIKELVGVSRSPLMFLKTDPVERIHAIWNNLPEQASEIRRYRRKALAEIAALQFFEAYRERDWIAVRRQAVTMLLNDLRWALNSGVRSICLESILGPDLMDRAKRFWRGAVGSLSDKGDFNQRER